MVLKEVQMYAEKVATRYDPHSNLVCVCGGGGGQSPPQHSQKLASMLFCLDTAILSR